MYGSQYSSATDTSHSKSEGRLKVAINGARKKQSRTPGLHSKLKQIIRKKRKQY